MTRLRCALLVLLCCFCIPAACRTSDGGHAEHAALPCTCGTPAADVEGCTHPECMRGVRNPDNPDCVCGTLDIR